MELLNAKKQACNNNKIWQNIVCLEQQMYICQKSAHNAVSNVFDI